MTFLPIALGPRVEREVQEAAQWYENQSQGLGAVFLEVIERTLRAIEENPLRFTRVWRDVRRALLMRFPYGVFFRLRGNQIRVIAIVHLYRHPEIWQRRS